MSWFDVSEREEPGLPRWYYSYTKAIEVSVKRDPVFFSNRAACKLTVPVPKTHSSSLAGYTNFSPPEYDKVVADCDEALKLDRT